MSTIQVLPMDGGGNGSTRDAVHQVHGCHHNELVGLRLRVTLGNRAQPLVRFTQDKCQQRLLWMLTGVLTSSAARDGPCCVFRELYRADPALHLVLLLLFGN